MEKDKENNMSERTRLYEEEKITGNEDHSRHESSIIEGTVRQEEEESDGEEDISDEAFAKRHADYEMREVMNNRNDID